MVSSQTKPDRRLKKTFLETSWSQAFKGEEDRNSKNLYVIIKKSNPQIRTAYHRFQSSKSPRCN